MTDTRPGPYGKGRARLNVRTDLGHLVSSLGFRGATNRSQKAGEADTHDSKRSPL